MAKRKEKPKYTGILNEPIQLEPPVGRTAFHPPKDEDWERQSRSISGERLSRTVALFDHYKIKPDSPNSWAVLAVALALDHVPGFRVESKAQPRRKRKDGSQGPLRDLIPCVEIFKLKVRGTSVTRACQLLAKRPEYKTTSAKRLERRFYDADPRILATAKEVAWAQHPDVIAFLDAIKSGTMDWELLREVLADSRT